jgi:hypothetical protein
MTIRQEYSLLGGLLAGEAVLLALLSHVTLRAPASGGAAFLLATAIVFFYSVRHTVSLGITGGLVSALFLAYFSQSRLLPTALLFLLVTGACPSIEQLAPRLGRIVFSAAYCLVTALLPLMTQGRPALQPFGVTMYVAASIAVGISEARYLVRRSPLEEQHGQV